MRILLSAFSFAPHQGSEPGVGWRWALELAQQHEVVVLTDATRRAAAEAELQRHPQPRLTVEYHRPGWLRRVPLNSRTAQLLYLAWQCALLPAARRLHARHRFDLVIHLTYGVYRHPSFLGLLGVPFVFGPLGGGEDAPSALKRSLSAAERTRERLRALANRIALVDPLLWWSCARAGLILVKTRETGAALPWPFRRRAIVCSEIGVDAPVQAAPAPRAPGEPLRALFAGRLLGWKGVHLALQAVHEARRQGLDVELDIVGAGPFAPALRALHARLGLGGAVRFLGTLPQAALFERYGQAHVLLFPSLHDSSGNVVLEAQAHGCPVVCLDLGGPPTLVAADGGIVVATAGADEAEVARRLAAALQRLHADEPARRAMAQAARAHACRQTWRHRVDECLGLVRRHGLIPATA